MKEKQLEFNFPGLSNQKEFDEHMGEINAHASVRIKKLLDKIIKNKKYTKSELERLIALSKWTLAGKNLKIFEGKYNKD